MEQNDASFAIVSETPRALVVPRLVNFARQDNYPLLYLSKFVETENAQPAPAPVDEEEDLFPVELPDAEEDPDALSDGEPEPDRLLDDSGDRINLISRVPAT